MTKKREETPPTSLSPGPRRTALLLPSSVSDDGQAVARCGSAHPGEEMALLVPWRLRVHPVQSPWGSSVKLRLQWSATCQHPSNPREPAANRPCLDVLHEFQGQPVLKNLFSLCVCCFVPGFHWQVRFHPQVVPVHGWVSVIHWGGCQCYLGQWPTGAGRSAQCWKGTWLALNWTGSACSPTYPHDYR